MTTFQRFLPALMIFVLALPVAVRAEDTNANSAAADAHTAKVIKKKKKKAKKEAEAKAATASNATPEQKAVAAKKEEETKTARQKAEEGSQSRWSGQLNLTYNGSYLNDAFNMNLPNPNKLVPAPVVTLGGNVSARYRIDKATTVGLGTGVTLASPLASPVLTVANPNTDIARAFKVGPLHSFLDFGVTAFTDYQYAQKYGYLFQFSPSDELAYTTKFGLTIGAYWGVDYALFTAGTYSAAQKGNQQPFDGYLDPYIEYAFNKTFNLRSVIGISWAIDNDPTDKSVFLPQTTYQTLGVGISLSEAVFLYTYVQGAPYSHPIDGAHLRWGVSAIINLL